MLFSSDVRSLLTLSVIPSKENHPDLDVHTHRIYNDDVRFEWDEAKRAANLAKHGIDFIDALEMFAAPMFVRSDERKDYGEPRWQGLGIVQGRLMVIAYTKREPNTIRIISLRKANSREEDFFQDTIKD